MVYGLKGRERLSKLYLAAADQITQRIRRCGTGMYCRYRQTPVKRVLHELYYLAAREIVRGDHDAPGILWKDPDGSGISARANRSSTRYGVPVPRSPRHINDAIVRVRSHRLRCLDPAATSTIADMALLTTVHLLGVPHPNTLTRNGRVNRPVLASTPPAYEPY